MQTTMRFPFLHQTKPIQADHAPNRPCSQAECTTTDIIYLFETYGAANCHGERFSQASHMIQCAMLAMDQMTELPVIIGALLHDIGHLLKHDQNTEALAGYGVVDHEEIGAVYLHQKGFSERVCAIVQHHVNAKRYLVATDQSYRSCLSKASLQTLQWQGGPMAPDEVAAFEQHPYVADIIRVRRWDEEAKKSNAILLPISYFRKILWDHLSRQNA